MNGILVTVRMTELSCCCQLAVLRRMSLTTLVDASTTLRREECASNNIQKCVTMTPDAEYVAASSSTTPTLHFVKL
ncbi:hypothetical protein TNCV_2294081 [Trichonephila clavipes]|nr:hypothetical protein TNCV_2294081 [Trichonephila clavipes]